MKCGHFLQPRDDARDVKRYDARDVLELTRDVLELTRPRLVLVFSLELLPSRAPRLLRRPRQIPATARRHVVSELAAVVVHCRALYMPLFLHADSVLVSDRGDVVVSITPAASDARYTAPEAHFGFAPCAVWSVACLLFKCITGAPLVTRGAALRIVGTLHAASDPCRFDDLFDALDASAKWRNRAHGLRIPRGATLAERILLSHALTWSRRVRICTDGLFLVPVLDTIVE